MSDTAPLSSLDPAVELATRGVEAMIAQGAPLRDMLTRLASAAEQIAAHGSAASILLLDKDGLLRNGASPNLPADYLDAIDRLKPDPQLGTCAAAAAIGEMVFTPDFREDSKWAELKHLPLSIGYRGAWSVPIKDPSGRVLGTFGTYFRDNRLPGEDEIRATRRLAASAGRAILARKATAAP